MHKPSQKKIVLILIGRMMRAVILGEEFLDTAKKSLINNRLMLAREKLVFVPKFPDVKRIP